MQINFSETLLRKKSGKPLTVCPSMGPNGGSVAMDSVYILPSSCACCLVTSRHSPFWPHTVCCVLTEQELSEILLINWQSSNILQYLNRESWKNIQFNSTNFYWVFFEQHTGVEKGWKNIFTWKEFKKWVREETFHLATLNLKVDNFLQDAEEIETGMAESPAGTRQTVGKNMVWFGEIERKLAKLSKTTFTYRSSS